MADQKTAKAIREFFGEVVQGTEFTGFDFVGITDEGSLFQNVETGDFVVVRTIVKAETFDGFDAVQAHTEKLEKAAEKAAKSKAKAEKDKAKREKEKAEKEEKGE